MKIFLDEIRNEEKYINNEIFREYFGYQNLSFLAKDLIKVNKAKNNQIKNQAIYSMHELRNAVTRKKFLKIKFQIK